MPEAGDQILLFYEILILSMGIQGAKFRRKVLEVSKALKISIYTQLTYINDII